MKVIAHTGLVPVTALRRFRNHSAGSTFGVYPDIATQALKAGDVELAEIPEGIETIDVLGFVVDEPKIEVPEVSTEGLVAIPDDWRTAHGSKRAMIAKAILGLEPKAKLPVQDGQDIADFAISVIETELARRAVPPTDPVNPEVIPPVADPVVTDPPTAEPTIETPAETPTA